MTVQMKPVQQDFRWNTIIVFLLHLTMWKEAFWRKDSDSIIDFVIVLL